MEIALPDAIPHVRHRAQHSHDFASFTRNKIHGGIVSLGRLIHFRSLTGMDSVRACEISQVNTLNAGGPLQSSSMSFVYYLSVALLLQLTGFITPHHRSVN